MIYNPCAQAITNLVPNAQFSVTDVFNGFKWNPVLDSNGNRTGAYDNIPLNVTWNDDRPFPEKTTLDAEFAKVVEAYKNTEYQRLREPEYPSTADLADAMYWQSQGDDSKMTAYLAAVAAVKQKYPKPESV